MAPACRCLLGSVTDDDDPTDDAADDRAPARNLFGLQQEFCAAHELPA